MAEHLTTTVGELRQKLAKLMSMPDDTRVIIGQGDLSIGRVKPRGPTEGPALMQIEFNEAYTLADDSAS